jgi:hypothetical protein
MPRTNLSQHLLVLNLALALGTLLISLPALVSAQGPGSGWVQVNPDGFGNNHNSAILSLAAFNGQLYAGTLNENTGAQIWRTGSPWTAVMTDGFGNPNTTGIDHLIEFKGHLYASTWNWNDGGEVWRSSTGDVGDWTRVVTEGFGDLTNVEVFRFAVFSDTLYAGTWVYTSTHGVEIWRTNSGDIGDWQRVVSNGFDGDVNNTTVLSFETFNGYLYAGTSSRVYGTAQSTGGEVWRSNDGMAWTQVNTDGFGTPQNYLVSALAAFDGNLYASTLYKPPDGEGSGYQVWRCHVCTGSDWISIIDVPFLSLPDGVLYSVSALEVFEGYLYLVVGSGDGMQVWRSSTGDPGEWEQVGFAGFGNRLNKMSYYDNSVTVFESRLYVGTWKEYSFGGGEVWLHPAQQMYLPVILRDQ